MFKRRSLFSTVLVLLLVQNGILAILASHLIPDWTAVMMIALAAGVIVLSVATAMMATRIAGPGASARISATMPPASHQKKLQLKRVALDSRPRTSPHPAEKHISSPEPIRLKLENSGGESDLLRLRAAEGALDTLDTGLRRLAAGDLGVRCETEFPPQFEGLRCDFNRALDALDGSIAEITLSASALHGECAEARLRLMQERSTAAGELPQLSAAGNGLKDIADLLNRHEAALTQVLQMASAARQSHVGQQSAVETATRSVAALADSKAAAASVAERMRDVAFRTNMLAVNVNLAAAEPAPDKAMLRAFAAELQAIVEQGANAARDVSILEREIARSAASTISACAKVGAEHEKIDTGLAELETTLATISEATAPLSDLVARTATIVASNAHSANRRRDLDHVLDTVLARMAQDLATINRHCGRFIPVTLLRENGPPTDDRPPRRRTHLQLIKT